MKIYHSAIVATLSAIVAVANGNGIPNLRGDTDSTDACTETAVEALLGTIDSIKQVIDKLDPPDDVIPDEVVVTDDADVEVGVGCSVFSCTKSKQCCGSTSCKKAIPGTIGVCT